VPVWYKESMIGRSIGKSGSKLRKEQKREFKKKLCEAIEKLVRQVDSENLCNRNIREEIKKLANTTAVTIGQAQKVINVYLKYYCILCDKPLEELDCPLDSGIMKKHKNANYRPTLLKDMTEEKFDEYEGWQEHLRKVGQGIRIKPDIDCYDKNRIKKFLK